jgi:serine phosphatase RsbU (regulator of sigma subunit)/anti-sigma regulatory factor (Ser/Thr protein kinase)
VLEERRRLAEIVSTTSDGIATVGRDGTVLSWNPAMERITGLAAGEVVGRPGALTRLRPRTVPGTTVDIGSWQAGTVLPADLVITAVEAGEHRLACSYSVARDDDGQAQALVMVARDVTTSADVEELREEMGRLAEAEAARRSVVEQLQQAVMPARPDVVGADLGVSYLGSDPSAPTGGDIYDWQVLPDGDVHLCVVDVLGHGVGATKDALAVVHTLRVVTAEGRALEDVVLRADELLSAQHPELVATVVIARYTPSTGRLRVAAGGHPPALLVKAGGEVEQIAASGCAIGWPGAGSDLVVETTLGIDDALVLYTDGLIEARKDVIEGMEDLVRHAQALSALPAEELSRELIDRALAGAQRHDDTLALVLRRTAVVAATAQRTWLASPELASVPQVRSELRTWLTERILEPDDCVLAASELLANAVRAASREVRLTATVEGGEVRLEVADDGVAGRQLDDLGRSLPSDEAERGRGLFLVRAIASEVEVVSSLSGTLLRATIPVAPMIGSPREATAPRLRVV